MMPPPAMTTSALSIPGHSPELEDELQSGEGRDVSIVERWRYLDYVDPDGARASQDDSEQVEHLPRGHAACRWDLRSGRVSRIEHVDVQRNMDLLAGEPIGYRLRRGGGICGEL